MPRLYQYVGPSDIAEAVVSIPEGVAIKMATDVLLWVQETDQYVIRDKILVATFIVDGYGILRIADRHSEHIACAGGKPVLSAGEIGFQISKDKIEVVSVTNQSTGFCPEPISWPAVEAALEKAGLPTPNGFTTAFEFRRCSDCGVINVIKDLLFECAVCDVALPREWNFKD